MTDEYDSTALFTHQAEREVIAETIAALVVAARLVMTRRDAEAFRLLDVALEPFSEVQP